jgi:type IV secretory pathway TrbD component
VIYRSVFQGRLLGEPFDARLMIILHEHWWNWFNGNSTFRNTDFFYPYDSAFGFSEIFFAQGIIYSLFRMISLDALSAWVTTNILLILIGNLGWHFLGQRFINSRYLRLIFSLTMISSISFVAYFNFYQNILGYAFLSWFALLIVKIKDEKVNKRKQLFINIFIFSYLVYVLSCWYAAFFLGSILVVWYVSNVLSSFKRKRDFHFIKSANIHIPYILFFAPINLGLLYLFYYTQVSVLNDVNRLNLNIITNSPTLKDLLNSGLPYDGSRIFNFLAPISDLFLNSPTTDLNIGVGPLLIILTIFLGTFYIAKFGFKKDYMWITSVIALYLIFVKITPNFSLFSFLVEYESLLNAIRFPGRYVIILGFVLIFVIFVMLDRIQLNYKSTLIKTITIIIGISLLMDQQRSPYLGWEKSKFISVELVAFEDQIKEECDYFYFDFPGGGWWYEQIEAMALSMRTGVPTVNGYSGGFPIGYPVEVFNSTSEPKEIFNWIETISKSKRGCYLTGKSELLKLDSDFENLQLVGFDKSFMGVEKLYNSISPNPYLYLTSKKKKDYIITFDFKSNKCNPNQTLKIVNESDGEIIMELSISSGKRLSLEIDMTQSYVKRIALITDAKSCLEGANNSENYFSISDIKLI